MAAGLAVADQVAFDRARLGHTASVLLRPKRLFGIHREASVAMFFNPDAERVGAAGCLISGGLKVGQMLDL